MLSHPNVIKIVHVQQPRSVAALWPRAESRTLCAAVMRCGVALFAIPASVLLARTALPFHALYCSNLLVFSDLYIVFECLDTDAAKRA